MCNATTSIFSWNVRGLGDDSKCADALSERISINPSINPRFPLLQESKLSEIPDRKMSTFMPRSLDQNTILPTDDKVGGIVSATNSNHLRLISHVHHRFAMSLKLTSHAHPSPFFVTNVHALACHTLRQDFLDELQCIKQDDQTPWLLVGDFNLIRFSHEKNKPNFRLRGANAFNDIINELALIEIPLLDRRFTWSNTDPAQPCNALIVLSLTCLETQFPPIPHYHHSHASHWIMCPLSSI